jgi:hypothetical protein
MLVFIYGYLGKSVSAESSGKTAIQTKNSIISSYQGLGNNQQSTIYQFNNYDYRPWTMD